MEKMGAYLGEHPEAGPAIQEALAFQPPASYAQLNYHSIHAYRFENEAGTARHGRYHLRSCVGLQLQPATKGADSFAHAR